MTNRKKNNKIHKLTNDLKVEVEGQQGLNATAYGYFSNMFECTQSNYDPLVSIVQPYLIEKDKIKLVEPFTKAGFEKTLFQMHPGKSPGLDGLNVVFYQRLWALRGSEIAIACSKW